MSFKPGMQSDNRPAGSPPPVDQPLIIMTRITGRTPQWKSHRIMAHAKSAISSAYSSTGGIREIWRFGDDQWTQINGS